MFPVKEMSLEQPVNNANTQAEEENRDNGVGQGRRESDEIGNQRGDAGEND